MTIDRIIDVINEKRQEINIEDIGKEEKEIYVALGVAANILKRYDSQKISGYLSFLNAYAVADFCKDEFGRDTLVLHLPVDAKTTNWYHAVDIKLDLPSCFSSVSPDRLIESCEKEWEEAVKENSEPLPFSEGDDDVYDL